ncbi:hypothetical protein A2Y83_02930 [Candidatus Falkowbacteria bacterium RBG_13_39_14]|uniref:Response regulatory domain-containing protein n=1 Tax=Candidatus Falkowbacteria bacterium RBG_13_39_14 TaxID=1797985 RepID=A0A1F5S1G8_9BACT|nr:MAG: hypothetical protein A2Y83_02930 [Candidatus Falkowbacteria bacterium RBG_13_39_14]
MATLSDFLKRTENAIIEIPSRLITICIVDDNKRYVKDFCEILKSRKNIFVKSIIPPPTPDVFEIAKADIVLLDNDIACRPVYGRDIAKELKTISESPVIIAITDTEMADADYKFACKHYLWEEEAFNDFVDLINKVIKNL